MKIVSMLILTVVMLMPAQVWAGTAEGSQHVDERFEQAFREAERLGEQEEWGQMVQLLDELRDIPGMLESDWRRLRILYGLATWHTQLGQKQEALSCLREIVESGISRTIWPGMADQLQKQEQFEPLWEEPEFKGLMAKLTAHRRFWENPAFDTAYREDISEDEKMAGLSRLWAEVKYNFAFFHQVPEVDWDALYVAYLPKVRETKSTLEYYRLLQELCAKLRDSHTAVYLPSEVHSTVYARPAIATELVEGKVIITDVFDDTLRAEGVNPGLELVEVDGVPVHDYARQQVMPYKGLSTQQSRELFTYREVLWGAEGRAVTVGLRDERGAVLERMLPRLAASEIEGKSWKPFEFEMLDGNIAYVVLNTVADEEVVSSFDAAFEAMQQADALIIDVRQNSGGSSQIGWQLLGRVTDKPFRGHVALTRRYAPYARAHGVDPWEVETSTDGELSPDGAKVFAKPVVVLTSAFTGSAAEDFCVSFDAMGRGTIIGEPTGGSTGQPLRFKLPGGGSGRVCTIESRYPDGEEYVGVGVQPDILVRPTVADVRAGRDTVLEAAVDYLAREKAE